MKAAQCIKISTDLSNNEVQLILLDQIKSLKRFCFNKQTTLISPIKFMLGWDNEDFAKNLITLLVTGKAYKSPRYVRIPIRARKFRLNANKANRVRRRTSNSKNLL